MTDTTNPTAKYSKNYSGDVGETPKSMAGTWHLEAPDGRRWAGSCPINCVAQELAERVPVQVQLARMLAIVAEPDLDERHATLGVEYGTGKVDDLVDKLHAEITELRAKLEALEKQRPCGYLPYGYVGRSAMVFGQPVPESVPIYLAAGARPVEPVQKLRPDFIAGYDAGMADAKRIQAHQPAPGAGDQVQMILKHRLIRKVEGDWLAASEFMTGEPDPSWLAKTEESPEEWRIEQARRVSGEQIQAGLTRAFASWKKPAPAAAVGPNDGSTPGIWFVRTQERFGELRDCFVSAPDCQGLPYGAEILGDDEYRDGVARKLADCKLIVAAVNAYRATPQPAPAAVAGLPFAIMDNELEALRRFDECVRDPDAGGHDVRKEMMKRLAEIGLVRRVAANIYEHTNFGLSVLNGDFDAAPTTQPAPAAQDDAKDAARWRYAVAIGENQAMNWLNVYNDWEGDGSFVDAIDAALEASKKEQS